MSEPDVLPVSFATSDRDSLLPGPALPNLDLASALPAVAPPESVSHDMAPPEATLTKDCALHLLVDGKVVRPDQIDEGTYHFNVPNLSGPIRIRSRTSVPLIDHATSDFRRLGVAVSRVVLRSDEMSIRIEHRSPLLSDGFHNIEPSHRWTDGDALIPPSLLALVGSRGIDIEVTVLPLLTYPILFDAGLEAEGPDVIEITGPLQSLALTSPGDHFEGVAYSDDGGIMGVAAAGANAILLYRRRADGRFEDAPFRRLTRPELDFTFPHDLVFVRILGRQYVVTIERLGRVSAWAVEFDGNRCADELIGHFTIEAEAIGAEEGTCRQTDALAFVPGVDGALLAICEYISNVVLFYQLDFCRPFSARLVSTFASRYLVGADGLAFSACGRWLAIANHACHAVSVFQRRPFASGELPAYDPGPSP